MCALVTYNRGMTYDEDVVYVTCDTFNISLSNRNDVETSENFRFDSVNITLLYNIHLYKHKLTTPLLHCCIEIPT